MRRRLVDGWAEPPAPVRRRSKLAARNAAHFLAATAPAVAMVQGKCEGCERACVIPVNMKRGCCPHHCREDGLVNNTPGLGVTVFVQALSSQRSRFSATTSLLCGINASQLGSFGFKERCHFDACMQKCDKTVISFLICGGRGKGT